MKVMEKLNNLFQFFFFRIRVPNETVDRNQVLFELDFGSTQLCLKADVTSIRDEWVKGQLIEFTQQGNKAKAKAKAKAKTKTKTKPKPNSNKKNQLSEIATLTGVQVLSESPFLNAGAQEKKEIQTTAIYQGALQTYSEGFWGKGKWTDRYVVLEEGLLTIFNEERHFISAEKEPVERLAQDDL